MQDSPNGVVQEKNVHIQSEKQSTVLTLVTWLVGSDLSPTRTKVKGCIVVFLYHVCVFCLSFLQVPSHTCFQGQ